MSIKVTNIRVMNFDGVIHGIRNPINSNHLSDSLFNIKLNDVNEAIDETIENG